MLYLDYGRKSGEWSPNTKGGNENLDAIAFLQKLNTEVFGRHKGVMMIAEESTAFPLVTKPVDSGGLGFNFKWNMGWMNDVLNYAAADPFFRKDMHDKLTFSITYAYSENYVLPISHDEVVHGKRSLLNKMPGDTDMKFAQAKAFYAYMAAHPGKKLLFMGSEFGQFIEFDEKKELDWFLLEYQNHKDLQDYVKSLNKFYLKTPELWQQDTTYNGFRWIVVDDNRNNTIAFQRISKSGSYIICIINFSPVPLNNYRMGVPEFVKYKTAFSGGLQNKTKYPPIFGQSHGFEQYINIDIPANGAVFLRPVAVREK